jgi:broad specificity polyphosphatase/5'/3'-nucleotidase SurE
MKLLLTNDDGIEAPGIQAPRAHSREPSFSLCVLEMSEHGTGNLYNDME